MRRPKGSRTRKAVSKRFKLTATGKVLRTQSGKRHLLSCKSPKRRRNMRGSELTHNSDTYRVTQNLPFDH